MNTEIMSTEEVLKLFEVFLDQASSDNGVIEFNDYLQAFRDEYGAGVNSPMEMTFRGFIGGLLMASVDLDMIK
jgi:hypothetical protein